MEKSSQTVSDSFIISRALEPAKSSSGDELLWWRASLRGGGGGGGSGSGSGGNHPGKNPKSSIQGTILRASSPWEKTNVPPPITTTTFLEGRILSDILSSSPTPSPAKNETATPSPSMTPLVSKGNFNPIPAIVGVALIFVCCIVCVLWSERNKPNDEAQNTTTRSGDNGQTPQQTPPQLVGGMEPEERWSYIRSHLASIIVQGRNSMSMSIRGSKQTEPHRSNSKRVNSLFGRSKRSMAMCAICLLEYEDGDKMCESNNPKCNHKFHKECMTSWLAKHEECPCCRQKFLIVEDRMEEKQEEGSD